VPRVRAREIRVARLVFFIVHAEPTRAEPRKTWTPPAYADLGDGEALHRFLYRDGTYVRRGRGARSV
jgi:hypothetical protein